MRQVEKRVEYADDEQQHFTDLVLNAIGFNAAQGVQQALDPQADVSGRFSFSVKSMPVYQGAERGPGHRLAALLDQAGSIARYLAGIVAIVLAMVAWQLKRSHASWEAEQARMREEQAAEEARIINDPTRERELTAQRQQAREDPR